MQAERERVLCEARVELHLQLGAPLEPAVHLLALETVMQAVNMPFLRVANEG